MTVFHPIKLYLQRQLAGYGPQANAWSKLNVEALCIHFFCVLSQHTRFKVQLTEVLGSVQCNNHHSVFKNIFFLWHLKGGMCAWDQTVLMHNWVDSLHPAVSEIYPIKEDNMSCLYLLTSYCIWLSKHWQYNFKTTIPGI